MFFLNAKKKRPLVFSAVQNFHTKKTKVDYFWYTDANFVQFVCIANVLLFCKDGSREQSQYQVYPAELHCVKKRGVQQEVSFHCNIFSQEQTVKMAARPCNIFVQTCDFLFFFFS